MFGRKNKKKIEKLQSEITVLKSQLPGEPLAKIDFRTSGLIPLFNFNDSNQVEIAANTVPELKAVLNYMARSFSSGIFEIQDQNGDEAESDLSNLLKKPNNYLLESEFKQLIITELLVHGRCHVWVDAPGFLEFAKNMMILKSAQTEVYVGNADLNDFFSGEEIIKYYRYYFNGKYYNINPSEVFTITLNTDVYISNERLQYSSPLKSLEPALMVTPAMYDSMQNLMNYGGMKGFITNRVTAGEMTVTTLDDEDKQEILKAFKRYGTKSGQSDIGFTNKNVDYVAISSRIKDMLLPEQQEMIKKIIADVLNFDTTILNSNSSNKYANYQQARESLFSEILIPASKNVSESFTDYFFKFNKNRIIVIDYSGLSIFSEDLEKKAKTNEINSKIFINLKISIAKNEMTADNAINFLILSGMSEEDAKSVIL